jgi:transposase
MSHESIVQSNRNGQHTADVVSPPAPKVVPKAKRRRFTAEYKLRILAEADACTQRGAIGALLRREGLYHSHLDKWREQRRAGAFQALNPQKRGPKPDPQAVEIARLHRENERLQQRLQRAETIIEVQKNSLRCSACRRARATRSHDPDGRRTGGVPRHRRRLRGASCAAQ